MIQTLFNDLKTLVPYFQNSHIYDGNRQAWEVVESNIKGLKPTVQNVNMLKVIEFCKSSKVICADATLYGEYSKGNITSFEWWVIDRVIIMDFLENGSIEILVYKGKEMVKNNVYFV